MNLFEALNWRYAVKRFSDDIIDEEEVKQLLNASRLSASAYGLQPYKLIVIKSKELRARLIPYSYGQEKVMQSSHLIVFAIHSSIGSETVDNYINKYEDVIKQPGKNFKLYVENIRSELALMSPEEKVEWAHKQSHIALGNMLTCAALMKIDCCPMAGFDKSGYDRILKLKEKNLTASVICPIGRRHNEDVYANQPKVRFDFKDIVIEM